MSVYEEAYASPSRVIGVFRYLLHLKGQRCLRAELEEMMMPDHLPLPLKVQSEGEEEEEEKKDAPKRNMVRRTVGEALTMELFAADGEDVLLHPSLAAPSRSPKTGEALLPRTLTTLLLSASNTANHDLARAIAWYLDQDVYDAPTHWSQVDTKNFSAAVTALAMTNSRFGQLLHWSRYLGFSWAHATRDYKGVSLVPDPYRQIRWALTDLFSQHSGSVLLLSTVIPYLSSVLPVLDGGVFRTELEGKLLPTREPHQLSSATAHALMRLSDESVFKLAYRSDGTVYVFPDGVGDVRFTEVAWQGNTQ